MERCFVVGEGLRGGPPARSGERGPEQDASRGRMFQKRDDEVAVAVEGGSASHERHQTVGAREREETVDVLVAEPLRDAAQDELPAELRSEALAPLRLVLAERCGRCVIATKRTSQCV